MFIFLLLITLNIEPSACFSFLAVGDWGGIGFFPYYTPKENRVAKRMDEIAQKQNSSFVLALGDNFYFHGVANEYDSRFIKTFESVYSGSALQVPWYVLAGNHDHYGNITAQIAYSKYSKRWNFPSLYYDFIIKLPNGMQILIVMIDTITIAGQTDDNSTVFEFVDHEAADEQLDWINKTLSNSTADFILVCGHYPIWSVAEHGPTDVLVKKLRPMLVENQVTAYLAGHDHTLQFFDDLSGTVYVQSGAGNFCDSSTKHKDDVPENSLKFNGCDHGGFVEVSVDDTMVFNYYYGENWFSSKSGVAYSSPPLHPRTSEKTQIEK